MADAGHDVQPGEARHAEVGQHGVVAAGLEAPQALAAVGGGVGLVAPRLQEVAQERPHVAVIVDDQDSRRSSGGDVADGQGGGAIHGVHEDRR